MIQTIPQTLTPNLSQDVQQKTQRKPEQKKMSSNNASTHQIHRVGSITLGCCLIVFGILFILHTFWPMLSYAWIFQLWPIILIALGVEVLTANLWKSREMQYDKGAVILLILMALFAMGMACADLIFREMQVHY